MRKKLLKFLRNILKSVNSHFITDNKIRKMIPSIYTIETSAVCNLKCPECFLGAGKIIRKKHFMTFDELKLIANKIRSYAKYVYLHNWGEPMLNPHIFEIIQYVSEFAKTNISTNAVLLSENDAEKLIKSGVSDIIISIDGVTQEVYCKYRVGGNVDNAFNSLRALNYYNRLNGSKVKLIPQFVVFNHNEHEIEGFKKKCFNLGLSPVFKAPYLREKSQFKFSKNTSYIRKSIDSLKMLKTLMRHECQDVRNVMTILIDGSTIPCCYDFNGTNSFGNIFSEEVLDIWNSREYYTFRKNILIGEAPEFCINNCLMYYYNK